MMPENASFIACLVQVNSVEWEMMLKKPGVNSVHGTSHAPCGTRNRSEDALNDVHELIICSNKI